MIQNYNVPFPYIDFDHIHIYAIDPETRKRTTEYDIAQWITGSRIRPANVPPLGQKFMIERVTPRDASLVDYANGAVIEAEDLDLGVLQNLYICEELIDELEWYGNEVDLLWDSLAQLQTAYNTLRADHTALDQREAQHYNTLTQALATLRASLETTIAICQDYATQACDCATQACISKRQVHNWFCNWYNKFMPAIQNFMYLAIVDGGDPHIFSMTEEAGIIDGLIVEEDTDLSKLCIYDGRTPDNSTWWSWTEEALKLMKAHEYACGIYQMLNEIECFRKRSYRCDELFNILCSGTEGQVLTRTSTGWIWRTLGENETIDPETGDTHDLTITFELEDGTTVGNPINRSLEEGEAYDISVPPMIGYTASADRITGVMGGEDVDVTVVYTPVMYTLTIQYQFSNGATAAQTYSGEFAYGESFSVTSPTIEGFNTTRPVVSGTMPARNYSTTVLYS